jgi:hypothetical protein
LIRISLRDPAGKETASAVVDDPLDAPEKAATMLVGLHRLDPGHILFIDCYETGPHKQPEPGVACVTVDAGNLNSLAARLDAKARAERAPPEAADLRLAARICRHAVRWVGKGSVAIA